MIILLINYISIFYMKLCVTNESYIKYTYMISQKHNHMMLWTMQALLRRAQPHQRDCGGKESTISNQNQSRIHSKCMEPRHVSTSTHAHDGNVQHQNIPPPSLSLSLSLTHKSQNSLYAPLSITHQMAA